MSGFDAERLARKLAPAGERARSHVGFVFRRIFRGLSAKTLEVFWFQLSTMLGAGVAIRQALHTLADQHGGRARRVFSELAAECDAGGPLSAALERRPEVFGTFAPAMVRSAENTGGLDTTFALIARTLERFRRVRTRVVTALLYPAVLLHLSVLILNAAVLFKVGFWAYLLQIVLVLLPLYLGLSALVLLYLFVRETTWFGELLLGMFVFGKISQKSGLARWARTLAALFESGVPLPHAAQIAADMPANAALRSSLREVVPALMDGHGLAVAMQRPKYVTRMVRDMIATGEHSGSLGTSLAKIADFYEDEAEAAIHRMAVLVPLFLYLVLIGSLAKIIIDFWLGYYGPLLNL